MSHDSQQAGLIAEQAVAAEIERHGRDAIVLQPAPLPVLSGRSARSFFGGLPQLPPQLTWPARIVDSHYSYFKFVAQIDLSELPEVSNSPLPKAGTLYFFANLTKEWMDPDDARVLFSAPSGDACEERAPPSIGVAQPGDPWPWLAPGELTTHPHYKHPIRFVPCRSYRDYLLGPRAEQGPPGTLGKVHAQMQLRALEAAFGPRRTLEEVWTLDADDNSWPFAWSVVEHATRALCDQVTRICDDAPDRDEAFEPVLLAATEWAESAREHDTLSRPDASTCAEFRMQWRAWREEIVSIADRLHIPKSDCYKYPIIAAYDTRRPLQDKLLCEAIRLACCLYRDRRGDESLVPEKYWRAIDDDWGWHCRASVRKSETPPSFNQMLGYGEPVQATPLDRIDDVLLLQIKADMYRPWWADSDSFGVIQFWIEREDLARGLFDRVSVNFDCT